MDFRVKMTFFSKIHVPNRHRLVSRQDLQPLRSYYSFLKKVSVNYSRLKTAVKIYYQYKINSSDRKNKVLYKIKFALFLDSN